MEVVEVAETTGENVALGVDVITEVLDLAPVALDAFEQIVDVVLCASEVLVAVPVASDTLFEEVVDAVLCPSEVLDAAP